MPRTPSIRRYFFNALTVISLLLVPGLVGLGVRSDQITDEFKYVDVEETSTTWQADYLSVKSRNRRLEFALGNFESFDPQLLDRQEKDLLVVAFGPGWRDRYRNGFHLDHYDDSHWPKLSGLNDGAFPGFRVFNIPNSYPSTGDHHEFAVPHWFAILLFTMAPVIWVIKWRKRRKFGPNACRSCGYDMTGNQTGQCPECGTEALLTASTAAR